MSTVIKYTKRPSPEQKRKVFRDEVIGQVRRVVSEFLNDPRRKITYINLERAPANKIEWWRKKNCTLNICSEHELYPIALCAILDVLDAAEVKYIEFQGFFAIMREGIYSEPDDFIKIRNHATVKDLGMPRNCHFQ